MWKCKWYDDNDEYYGYGNEMNAYQLVENGLDVDYLIEGWNNQDGGGVDYESPNLVDWQLLVAPGLM